MATRPEGARRLHLAWPGLDTDIVVTQRVRDAFQNADVPGVDFTVDVAEKALTAYSRPLFDFWVEAWRQADRDASSLTEVGEGREASYRLDGDERYETDWNPGTSELAFRRVPRIPGMGVFVPGAHGVFRVRELPGWIMCTDDVRRLVIRNALSNVSFLEVGQSVG